MCYILLQGVKEEMQWQKPLAKTSLLKPVVNNKLVIA